jgi:hypothetical protein
MSSNTRCSGRSSVTASGVWWYTRRASSTVWSISSGSNRPDSNWCGTRRVSKNCPRDRPVTITGMPSSRAPRDGDRVDRLVAPLAHVRVAVEAVAEDLVHHVGRGELVGDAEVGDAAAHVLLGALGDESVVEGERMDLPAALDQLVERIRRVLAARQQVQAVDVARAATPGVGETLVEVGLGAEPALGLGCDGVEGATGVADTFGVEFDPGTSTPSPQRTQRWLSTIVPTRSAGCHTRTSADSMPSSDTSAASTSAGSRRIPFTLSWSSIRPP